MRTLTLEEQAKIDERRNGFDAFFEDMMAMLGGFAEHIGLADPHMIIAEPRVYLSPISDFLRDQVIEEEDRVWIVARLGFFIGEILAKDLKGCWFLNEVPDTRYFLRYVVSRVDSGTRTNAMVDPFEAASNFAAHPPGRNLSQFIREIEAACFDNNDGSPER